MNAIEALNIVGDRAQWMRNEGESDMRSIIWLISGLINDIEAGKSTEEIMASYADEDDEDEE
jgi:hypothetical protein